MSPQRSTHEKMHPKTHDNKHKRTNTQRRVNGQKTDEQTQTKRLTQTQTNHNTNISKTFFFAHVPYRTLCTNHTRAMHIFALVLLSSDPNNNPMLMSCHLRRLFLISSLVISRYSSILLYSNTESAHVVIRGASEVTERVLVIGEKPTGLLLLLLATQHRRLLTSPHHGLLHTLSHVHALSLLHTCRFVGTIIYCDISYFSATAISITGSECRIGIRYHQFANEHTH